MLSTLNMELPMHLRERVLGLARLHTMRGEPIPADILAEADSLGILLTELDQPPNKTAIQQRQRRVKNGDIKSKLSDLQG